MSNVFLVTSAINSPHGSVTPAQRLEQTLETVSSIRQRVSDVKIAVLEVGPQELSEQQQQQLRNVIDLFVPLTQESMMQQIFQCGGPSDFWIKTPGEIWAMAYFLNQSGLLTDEDRIFKISGRYRLNARFDLRNHENSVVSVGVRKPAVTYYDPEGKTHPLYSPWQYSTRLYSFSGNTREIMAQKFLSMFDFVVKLYANSEFTDVEHAFYHFCHDLQPQELPWLGVEGIMAPSGDWISE